MKPDGTLVDAAAAASLAVRFREQMLEAILAAHKEGHSMREIAEAVGMSHQRIHQLLKKAEEAK